ncbi:hypothetical protein D3C71_1801860 [compost metagenome]
MAEYLLAGTANVLRAALHPEGMAPSILNFGEWRAHILHRLRHQIETSGDPVLEALYAELQAYPPPPGYDPAEYDPAELTGAAHVAVPCRMRTPFGELSFISTTTVFGTPMDVTLAELAIESFFPADAATAKAMREFGASLTTSS